MIKKSRYEGIQTMLKALGYDGCHFLALLSIAEEFNSKAVDLIDIVRYAMDKKWINHEFLVMGDGTAILEYLTGVKWTRKEVVKLPVIRDNDYTEAIWYNPNTGYRHYRRRYFDTLIYSLTVAEGYIEKYYIYTAEVA